MSEIAVLGTGAVGSALGVRLGQAGHRIFYGLRSAEMPIPGDLLERSGPQARGGTCAEAIAASAAVLLAVPWDQTRAILDSAGNLRGKILIDCINPLTSDLKDLEFGHTTSAAEQIAAWYPAAQVVKAFNVLSAAAMANPHFGSEQATMFFCGDDKQAKELVRQLAADVDFDPVDCGPLRAARWLESMAMLYVHLAVFEGWGGDCALKMMKR